MSGMGHEFHMSEEMIYSLDKVKGIELFRGLIKQNERTWEGGEDLEGDVDWAAAHLADTGWVAFNAIGWNGTGKSSSMMALRRVFHQRFKSDRALKKVLKEKGVDDVDVLYIPFSLCDDVVKLPLMQKLHSDWYIPEGYNPSNYTFEHTKGASKWQWEAIEKYALSRKGAGGKATVLLVEGSTILCEPASDTSPVEVRGNSSWLPQDLGVSTFINMALDPRTREDTQFYIFDRDEDRESAHKSAQAALSHRGAVNQGQVKTSLSGTDVLVVTIGGQEVKVSSLPYHLQQQIVKHVLPLTSAPPAAIAELERRSNLMIEDWVEAGEISDYSRRELANKFGEKIGLEGSERFSVVAAPFLENKRTKRPVLKTVHLDAWFDSLPVRLYPQILDPFNLEELRNYGDSI